MKSLLVSWVGVGSILAAGAAGYVGVTAAQVVSMATAEEVSATAVADPPVLATRSTAPAPAAAPPVRAAESSRIAAAAPSRAVEPPSATEPPAHTGPSAPARRTAEPPSARTRQRQLEIKHARWADRQLAAMLRATPHSVLWFGGAAWVTPVADYHLTARFGETSSLWSSTHTGLDFAAPTGTPVRAATAGTVTSVGWAGAYGNRIEITLPDGTETWYAHLSRTDVRVGTQVGTGAVIGAVGATGNVTGPHLHFEVRPGGGDPVDPGVALEQHGVRP